MHGLDSVRVGYDCTLNWMEVQQCNLEGINGAKGLTGNGFVNLEEPLIYLAMAIALAYGVCFIRIHLCFALLDFGLEFVEAFICV